MGQKIAFGLGMLANQMFPAALGIFMVVLVENLGMPSWMWGVLFFVPRIVDAFFDPIMGFISDLFNDDNNINEKSVVGFASFAVMVICITVDLVTGWMGKELLINEYIFNGFLTITLGSFGIASVDKFVN
jgi:hypothetical protein